MVMITSFEHRLGECICGRRREVRDQWGRKRNHYSGAEDTNAIKPRSVQNLSSWDHCET